VIDVQRINYLARKAKEQGLTEEEKEEQQRLRQEYIAAVKRNLEAQLGNIKFVDEKDNKKVKI
jgi:uncharacterized protein YnzC (UPF0291/DUF896 family)